LNIPRNLERSLGPLGRLLLVIGILLLIPVFLAVYFSEFEIYGYIVYLGYLLPALISMGVGTLLDKKFEQKSLNLVQGLYLTGIAWIIISFFCALPFTIITEMGFLNSYFEAVSGFTTTGITMIENVNVIPNSLLFFRAFIQWIGGLGIITFFLFIGRKGISEHILYRGESHKAKSPNPVPNLERTIKYLWTIYIGFTVVLISLLWLQGVTFFDATAHAFTTVSTGGFSTHNASIGFYQGLANYRLIEYTIIVFMFLGGTNFVIHYRFLKGKIRSVWDNMEMKLWWSIVIVATVLVMISAGLFGDSLESLFRTSLFQVVSIATTTGFGTEYIGSEYFGALAKQVFLILMVIGGCVGSTAGGIKVKRVGIMVKGIWNHIKKASRPREMITNLTVDGEKISDTELMRVFTIFASWILLLVIGGMVTALLSNHDPFACFSGMFSALGNIGPSYLGSMVSLNPIIKIFYIFAMLVGRLEILPIFILLNREVWVK